MMKVSLPRLPSAAFVREALTVSFIARKNSSAADATPASDETTRRSSSFSSTSSVRRSKFFLEHSSSAQLNDVYDVAKKVLGEGGFGSVRQATMRGCSEAPLVRAVKTISKRRLNDESQARHEVAMLRRLDHPHVCKVFESFEDPTMFHLVLEYIEGEDLFDFLRSHWANRVPLMVSTVVEIVHQSLQALYYCHSQGVLHRDVKPENIMVERQKETNGVFVRLIDFGLSAAVDSLEAKAICGTRQYMAPELTRGKSYATPASDLWGVGVIMHVAFLGELPSAAVCSGIAPITAEIAKYNETCDSVKQLMFGLLSLKPPERLDAARREMLKEEGSLVVDSIPKGEVCQSLLASFAAFHQRCLLQRAVLTALAMQITCDKVEVIRQRFINADTDGNGKLSKVEIIEMITSESSTDMAPDMASWIDSIFQSTDTDNSGELEYAEFLAASMQEGALRSEQSLFAAFRAFDRDNSGKISKHEFGRVIELSPACVSELKGKLKRRIGGKAASADEDYEETIDVEHVEDEEEEAATRLDFERKLRNGNRTCDTCHSNVTGMSYWHCGGCDDTVCIMCLRRAEASAEPCCPDCATDALMLRTYQAPDCTDACRFRHREGCIGCGRHSTLEGRSECAICDAMLCIACIYAYEGDGGMVPVCRACAEDEWCKGGRVMTWRRQFERLVNVFDYGSGEHLGVSTYYHDSMSATEVARNVGNALGIVVGNEDVENLGVAADGTGIYVDIALTPEASSSGGQTAKNIFVVDRGKSFVLTVHEHMTVNDIKQQFILVGMLDDEIGDFDLYRGIRRLDGGSTVRQLDIMANANLFVRRHGERLRGGAASWSSITTTEVAEHLEKNSKYILFWCDGRWFEHTIERGDRVYNLFAVLCLEVAVQPQYLTIKKKVTGEVLLCRNENDEIFDAFNEEDIYEIAIKIRGGTGEDDTDSVASFRTASSVGTFKTASTGGKKSFRTVASAMKGVSSLKSLTIRGPSAASSGGAGNGSDEEIDLPDDVPKPEVPRKQMKHFLKGKWAGYDGKCVRWECPHCIYVISREIGDDDVKTRKTISSFRRRHLLTKHPKYADVKLYVGRQRPVARRHSAGVTLAWKCPLCPAGIAQLEIADFQPRIREAIVKEHRNDAHADVTQSAWLSACQKAAVTDKRRKTMRLTTANRAIAQVIMKKKHVIGDHNIKAFKWPQFIGKLKRHSHTIGWHCTKCMRVKRMCHYFKNYDCGAEWSGNEHNGRKKSIKRTNKDLARARDDELITAYSKASEVLQKFPKKVEDREAKKKQ
eukprot:TRINITY_DN20741_c0_g1_i5.p2 TRINITY_DN20741_c0_g1~~TRINITY_DN20741_c0_g1_i5.p2  ORF type:complete len:1279 (-),score=204.21 TRINITY_DN20741_c0_g1_i5:4324-8160(-)